MPHCVHTVSQNFAQQAMRSVPRAAVGSNGNNNNNNSAAACCFYMLCCFSTRLPHSRPCSSPELLRYPNLADFSKKQSSSSSAKEDIDRCLEDLQTARKPSTSSSLSPSSF